jgi:hypothetical protein
MLGLYSVIDYPSRLHDPSDEDLRRGTVTGTIVVVVVLTAGVLDCSTLLFMLA